MGKKTAVRSRKKPAAIVGVKAPVAANLAKSAKAPVKSSARATGSKKTFPIVGIGASAGGLEALDQFFHHVPANCGMGFVVVQHIDPTRKGVMHELLGRITSLPVVQAGNGMKVEPGHVYTIPPNKDISILHGHLQLLDPAQPRGARLPIDFFLKTLAADQQERSVGVILSGMGADGTLGARAIKEQGGLMVAQEPNSAKFDSMPRSVIDSGLADVVASAAELPAAILGSFRGDLAHTADDPLIAPEPRGSGNALDNLVILLRERSGNDFSLYKKSTMYRRIERRMAIHRSPTISLYVRYLRKNPDELDLLFKELLIGVTSFFRDAAAWEDLKKQVLTPLLTEAAAKGSKNVHLRAWVAGCSTGEEAYSLAMAFREALDAIKPTIRITLQIFATDLDADAVDYARRGVYPATIAAAVSPERLSRFFVEEDVGQSYRISKEVREMVVFAVHNVIMDAPFTRLDILCCRNLLIYFTAALQKKLFPLMHYALRPGGTLFLGSAETIGGYTDLFEPLKSKWRLYRKLVKPRQRIDMDFPVRQHPHAVHADEPAKATVVAYNFQELADQVLLQRFAPPAVLVNAEGDILYISGRTGPYLEPAAGRANWNIYVMARGDLRQELSAALPKVLLMKDMVTVHGVVMGNRLVDVALENIEDPPALSGTVMIVFSAVARPPLVAGPKIRDVDDHGQVNMQRELLQAHARLQSLREQMQTSREELKSANEELQSTNEELQSTNEELTTSKEEMQSLNEELQTVNTELQSKVDDLSIANSDLRNLLNSAEIAIVFLDNVLHVRRFTSQATKIFKLLASDVGRPLFDIVSELNYPELQADAHEVLRTLVFSEKQVSTREGRWFTTKIIPYRTVDNVIDGVVITFSDITVAKQLEAELRETQPTPPDVN